MATALGGPGAAGVPPKERIALWEDIASHISEPQTAWWPDGNASVWVFAEADNPKTPAAGARVICIVGLEW